MYDYYSDDIYDIDDFLAHYGVKGMKWGVRKARRSSGGKKRSSSGKAKIKRGFEWLHRNKHKIFAVSMAATIGTDVIRNVINYKKGRHFTGIIGAAKRGYDIGRSLGNEPVDVEKWMHKNAERNRRAKAANGGHIPDIPTSGPEIVRKTKK